MENRITRQSIFYLIAILISVVALEVYGNSSNLAKEVNSATVPTNSHVFLTLFIISLIGYFIIRKQFAIESSYHEKIDQLTLSGLQLKNKLQDICTSEPSVVSQGKLAQNKNLLIANKNGRVYKVINPSKHLFKKWMLQGKSQIDNPAILQKISTALSKRRTEFSTIAIRNRIWELRFEPKGTTVVISYVDITELNGPFFSNSIRYQGKLMFPNAQEWYRMNDN